MLIIPIPPLIFSRTQAAANPLNFTMFLSLKANTQIKIKKKKKTQKPTTVNHGVHCVLTSYS